MSRGPDNLEALMEAAQRGDGAAYERLLTEVAGLLRPYVSARMGRSDDVDEVVQDILLSIHQSRHTYLPGRPLRPWLFAIARYRVVDHFRKWARTRGKEVDGRTFFETLVGEPSGGEDVGLKMAGALNALTDQQRQVVTLLKLDGLSIRQASERLGLSESAVKVTAHRAYRRLKRAMEGEDYENR